MFQSAKLGRLLGAATMALAALALLAPAAQAVEEPLPGFTQFAGCPNHEENPLTYFCIRTNVTGGHLQSGSKDVPIENPLVLSGGLDEAFENFDASPAGGLSKVKQEVPGGVVGITGLSFLIKLLPVEALKLYAVTELAGTPSEFTFSSVTLPIKVHLVNPVLGNNCYIGSDKNPIVLHLTTGTTEPPPPNEPITGKSPTFVDGGEIVYLKEGTFVDNSFAVPGASGCTLTLLGFLPINLDGLVNTQAGLPSPAGTNETTQDFTIEFSLQELVY